MKYIVQDALVAVGIASVLFVAVVLVIPPIIWVVHWYFSLWF